MDLNNEKWRGEIYLLKRRTYSSEDLLLRRASSFPASFDACFSSADQLYGERFKLLLVSHSRILSNGKCSLQFLFFSSVFVRSSHSSPTLSSPCLPKENPNWSFLFLCVPASPEFAYEVSFFLFGRVKCQKRLVGEAIVGNQ